VGSLSDAAARPGQTPWQRRRQGPAALPPELV